MTAALAGLGLVGLLAGAALVWSAPRDDVAVPGPDATPEEVVTAYLDAVDGRDFDTANAIDARPGSDLGRFSRPGSTDGVSGMTTADTAAGAQVTFRADIEGGDGQGGWWGYLLERDGDGRWVIVDAGVA